MALIWPKAVGFFTGKDKKQIFDDGGTQSWRARSEHLIHTPYAVLVRSNVDWSEGPEAPGTAFLVGKISGVVPSSEDAARYKVLFSEYAEVNVPNAWKGWRNPVRYAAIDEFGIDLGTLVWKSMPKRPNDEIVEPQGAKAPRVQVAPLTILQAKLGLAAHLGVKPEAIEIVVRG